MTLNVSEDDATASKVNNNESKPLKLENIQNKNDSKDTENPLVTKTTIVIPPDGGWGWMVMVRTKNSFYLVLKF
jgi:hypothetical protein